MNKITMDKKYKTRDGRSVRVIAIDIKNDTYPVAAATSDEDGVERVSSFSVAGYYYNGDTDEMDLIEVSPFKKDDLVMVRSSSNGKWVRRFFHSMSVTGDMFCCYNDGRNSWSENVSFTPSKWAECRAYDSTIDGE